MFSIKIIRDFAGAHRLRNYKGKCEELHGHNWKVEAAVFGNRLDAAGMLYDFSSLKKMVDDILLELDHKYLNELKPFEKDNPTSENIAKYIFGMLAEKLAQEPPSSGVRLSHVTVWETGTSAATYQEGAGGFLSRETTP
jgi:6-pyruvoyltetrahydropterin/6-carboxytetrahydropterin synthase